MNSLRHIVAIVCLLLFGIAKPAAAEDLPKGEDADVKEIVFGHIGDAYGWHITTWGETHVTRSAAGDRSQQDRTLERILVVAPGTLGRI